VYHLHHPVALIKNRFVFAEVAVDHLSQKMAGTKMFAGRPDNQHLYRFIARNFTEGMNYFADHQF